MKRLIKKSKHDISNREFAFVYADGKFFEDVTHAACIRQIIKEFNIDDIDLQSNVSRPAFSTFDKLSDIINNIVIGHHAKKEDAVYIIYGFIDGQQVYYDGIPNNIKQDIANNYELEVRNEMDHEDTGAYDKDFDKIQNDARDRLDKLDSEDQNKVLEFINKSNLSQIGNTLNFKNKDSSVVVKMAKSANCYVFKLGENSYSVNKKNIANETFECNSEMYKKLLELNSSIEVDKKTLNDDNLMVIFKCKFNTADNEHYVTLLFNNEGFFIKDKESNVSESEIYSVQGNVGSSGITDPGILDIIYNFNGSEVENEETKKRLQKNLDNEDDDDSAQDALDEFDFGDDELNFDFDDEEF